MFLLQDTYSQHIYIQGVVTVMPMSGKIKRILFPCLFLLLGILAVNNQIDKIFSRIGLQKITESTIQYLQTSFDKSVKGFLVLSTIKSGIAVLEGTEIGVGFKVEIGDLVQSVYDYVDIAWKTSLAGSTILLLMHLLSTTISAVNHYILAILLFFLSLVFALPQVLAGNHTFGRIVRETVAFLLVLVLTLYIILPLSIAGAAFLSSRITRPLVDEATGGFSSLQHELSSESLTERLFKSDEEEDLLGSFNIPRRLHATKKRLRETGTWLKTKMEDMAHWTIKLVAGYLFDCIIFPFVFFFILFSLSKEILWYIIGMRRDKNFKEDLATILKSYYGKSLYESKGNQSQNP